MGNCACDEGYAALGCRSFFRVGVDGGKEVQGGQW